MYYMKNWKRKTLVVGIALSLMIGSLGSAVAAPADGLRTEITNVYKNLLTGDGAKISAANSTISAMKLQSHGDYSFDNAIYNRISSAAASASVSLGSDVQEQVYQFILMFNGFVYDSSLSGLESYSNSIAFTGLAAALDDITDNGEIDAADVLTFYSQIQSATKTTVQSMSSFSNITDLLSFKTSIISSVDALINAGATVTAETFKDLGITAEDLLDTKMALIALDTKFLAADLALGNAYRRMLAPSSTPRTDDPTPTPTPPAALPKQAEQAAKEVLADLKDKLEDLPANDKKEELKKAGEAVSKAIKEAGTIEVKVVVTAGVAKPTIDTTAILAKAKEAKALADTLNKDLEAVGGKKVDIGFTLDLGTTTATNAQIPLDKALLDGLSSAGVNTISVVVNGVEISVNTKEFGANTILNIEKKTKAESGDTSNSKVASDYYEFNFTSNDKKVEGFNVPVGLSIPVENTDDLDTDLLTLGKVTEDGGVQYHVGKYDEMIKAVKGFRPNLSTYVIVENKVVFNDLDKVKSWAGRSIEVAAAKGIVSGRAEGVYDPSANVTRAEFAKMLVSTFSLYDNNATEGFDDVKDTDWFKSSVAIAYSKGIITGRTATSFDPNAPISRQEMAVMVARTLKLALNEADIADVDAGLSAFSDADGIGDAYKASAALVVDQGIINGFAGKFDPQGITTRAQAAVVIKNLIDLQ